MSVTVDKETGECTFDGIKFKFIELPKFKKKEDELVTVIDKWTYFIKKANKLEVVPGNTDDEGLLAAYEEAKKHNWKKEEYDAYIYAGMREQDQKGEINAAEKRGMEKQKFEDVIGLYENDVLIPVIAKSLKIAEEQVKEIIKNYKEKE